MQTDAQLAHLDKNQTVMVDVSSSIPIKDNILLLIFFHVERPPRSILPISSNFVENPQVSNPTF